MRKLIETIPTSNQTLIAWVDEITQLCKPDCVVWCDGSEAEKESLVRQAVAQGDVELLNQKQLPGCLYARSSENDVARVEELTFICTKEKQNAGPTNNWMPPQEAYQKVGEILNGSMRGRTMYVVPFLMGVPGSRFNKIGFELTDSLYVVLNMRIMTHMGRVALDELGDSLDFTRGVHSKVDLNEKKRFICHFPEDNTIWSVGSNYGGNVLLGKKSLALRIASWLGDKEGWLAEHMMIVGIQNPQGEIHYVTAAFPSQCGKTNLAMLVPPKSMSGYKVWTVGDDIAWLRIGEDGRLWAINPEFGFFGVAPGTNSHTNPNAVATVRKDTIFTNVAKKPDGTVWWEGFDGPVPEEVTDWRGQHWTPASQVKAAHPNSRFTAPASQCPSISPEWQNPKGVPISAIIFGGRRAKTEPLVYQSLNWQHGVYVGATMTSETTAAAKGTVGLLRHDPMAMLPFCGYNIGDYFGHWLEMGKRLKNPPKIFHVNWFRTDANGHFIWPGFGENLRVLKWVIERSAGKIDANQSPIGYVPAVGSIDLAGTALTNERFQKELLDVDREEWLREVQNQKEFLDKIGETLPAEIRQEHEALILRLKG